MKMVSVVYLSGEYTGREFLCRKYSKVFRVSDYICEELTNYDWDAWEMQDQLYPGDLPDSYWDIETALKTEERLEGGVYVRITEILEVK